MRANKSIVVFHSRHLPATTSCLAGWIYADENSELFQEIAAAFSPLAPLISPRQFQIEAAARRQQFVSWVDANMSARPVEDWLANPIHRCTFPSPAPPIFIHTVWLALIDQFCQKGNFDTLAIFTEHIGLAAAIERHAQSCGIPCRIADRIQFRVGAASVCLRSIASLSKSVVEIVARVALSRLLLGDTQIKRLQNTEILIDTYLHKGDLAKTGEFSDRYFPGLVQWYLSVGRAAASFSFLFRIRLSDLPATYRSMRKSDVPMAPFELFITFADTIKAFIRCCSKAYSFRSAQLTPLENIDMRPLLPIPRFAAALSSFVPLLLLRTPARMSKKGICPSWFLDWHENQTIDKATSYGFGQLTPPSRVIGMRQYVPVSNYLSEYSTPVEVGLGLVPREQWVCGTALPQLLDSFLPGVRYRVVPALRFAHVHSLQDHEGFGTSLLVLLTHSVYESVQILSLVFESLVLPTMFDKIIIKAQPNVPKTEVAIRRIVARRWPTALQQDWVIWSAAPTSELLMQSKLAVSSGTSAVLEAVCRGVPVVLAGNVAGLDSVPLEGVDKRVWRLAYDNKEYMQAVSELTDAERLSHEVKLEIARTTRSEYFQAITTDTMNDFATFLDT